MLRIFACLWMAGCLLAGGTAAAATRGVEIAEVSASGRFVRTNLGTRDHLVKNAPVLFQSGGKRIAIGRVAQTTDIDSVIWIDRTLPEAERLQPGTYEITYDPVNYLPLTSKPVVAPRRPPAAPTTSTPAAAKSEDSGPPFATFDPGAVLWTTYDIYALSNSPINANNSLRVPETRGSIDLRPQLKVLGQKWKATLRPRFEALNASTRSYGQPYSSYWNTRLTWSEAFATADLSPNWSVSYGLQNYQWGPAEAASPSNRIFLDTVQAKNLRYETRGRHLFRMNVTPAENWSEVFVFEPTSNGEPELGAGEVFASRALLKSELSWSGGANYAGLVLGYRSSGGSWIGEYGSVAINDSLNFYIDAAQQSGSRAYYPELNTTSRVITYSQTQLQGGMNNFLVAGLRYTSERGNELHLEQIQNGAGYDKSMLNLAWATLYTNYPPQLSLLAESRPYFERPGLEFRGQKYLYLSARIPDAFSVHDWTLFARALRSWQDGSSVIYVSSESAIDDQKTLALSFSRTQGKPGEDLTGLVTWNATFGLRFAW